MINYNSPTHFFKRRNILIRISIVILICLTLLSGYYTEFDTMQVFTSIPRVIEWIFTNLIPDKTAFKNLPKIISRLIDTILMALMATTTSSIFAFIFALMSAKSTKINTYLEVFSKFIASVGRNIPVVVWALLFLITFGMSTFTGYCAIFFSTFGFLVRAFTETIDQSSNSQVEALRATGATYSHIVAQAVVPAALPKMISWVLYMIETNIRDATLVGLLTGSGIGFLFDLYYKSQQYKSASMIVLLIVLLVIGIENLSNMLRRKIL